MRILVHFSPVWSPKITPQKKYSFCFSGSPNTDFLINLPSNTYKNAWLWLRRLSDVITSNYANHSLLTVLSHLFYPPMDTYSNVHDKRASEHIPLSFAGHCICKGFVDQSIAYAGEVRSEGKEVAEHSHFYGRGVDTQGWTTSQGCLWQRWGLVTGLWKPFLYEAT